jgi:hypothetical protein
MARKIAQWTVEDEGRDKGKVFLLTEMPASRAESWATRVLLALMGSNTNLPENFADMGMAGLAELGLKAIAGLKWEVAEPLLEEMLQCVQIIPNPAKPQVVRALVESDIEEILTRFKLRVEVWKLHMDFLQAVAPSFSTGIKSAAASMNRPNTRTSQK